MYYLHVTFHAPSVITKEDVKPSCSKQEMETRDVRLYTTLAPNFVLSPPTKLWYE